MKAEDAIRQRHRALPEPSLTADDTALLVIDMQYADAHPDYGLVARLKRRDEGAAEYYADSLRKIVPNIESLLHGFRERGMEVVHTHIESLTEDGRDRSLEHKNLGIHCPPGSKDAQVLEEVAPQQDEIVLSKTCGSVFNGTMIDYVLRNIGIQNLVVVGVVTSGCVEISVRDAADLGYSIIVVEDACATWSEEMQTASIRAMDGIYARVESTEHVLKSLPSIY